jgi:hypothetical protein
MAAPTPTAMPARRAEHPPAAIPTQTAGPPRVEEILFSDTATGQIGVVRQRPGDGIFVFHPRSADGAETLVEEPGRFRRAVPPGHDHAGHDAEAQEDAEQDDDQRASGHRRRRRANPRGHRGGGRGRRHGR